MSHHPHLAQKIWISLREFINTGDFHYELDPSLLLLRLKNHQPEYLAEVLYGQYVDGKPIFHWHFGDSDTPHFSFVGKKGKITSKAAQLDALAGRVTKCDNVPFRYFAKEGTFLGKERGYLIVSQFRKPNNTECAMFAEAVEESKIHLALRCHDNGLSFSFGDAGQEEVWIYDSTGSFFHGGIISNLNIPENRRFFVRRCNGVNFLSERENIKCDYLSEQFKRFERL